MPTSITDVQLASGEPTIDADATKDTELASQSRKPVIAVPPAARFVTDDHERPSFGDVHGLMDDEPQSARSW